MQNEWAPCFCFGFFSPPLIHSRPFRGSLATACIRMCGSTGRIQLSKRHHFNAHFINAFLNLRFPSLWLKKLVIYQKKIYSIFGVASLSLHKKSCLHTSSISVELNLLRFLFFVKQHNNMAEAHFSTCIFIETKTKKRVHIVQTFSSPMTA